MGRTTRGLTYNPGTNTLSGQAIQNQMVCVHVNGSRATFARVKSDPATGNWSVVLTGLAAGNHTVNVSLNDGTSWSLPLAITKP